MFGPRQRLPRVGQDAIRERGARRKMRKMSLRRAPWTELKGSVRRRARESTCEIFKLVVSVEAKRNRKKNVEAVYDKNPFDVRNETAFQKIYYYSMLSIDEKKTRDMFQFVYPTHGNKKTNAQFFTKTVEFLTDLRAKSKVAATLLPNPQKRVLMEYGGGSATAMKFQDFTRRLLLVALYHSGEQIVRDEKVYGEKKSLLNQVKNRLLATSFKVPEPISLVVKTYTEVAEERIRDFEVSLDDLVVGRILKKRYNHACQVRSKNRELLSDFLSHPVLRSAAEMEPDELRHLLLGNRPSFEDKKRELMSARREYKEIVSCSKMDLQRGVESLRISPLPEEPDKLVWKAAREDPHMDLRVLLSGVSGRVKPQPVTLEDLTKTATMLTRMIGPEMADIARRRHPSLSSRELRRKIRQTKAAWEEKLKNIEDLEMGLTKAEETLKSDIQKFMSRLGSLSPNGDPLLFTIWEPDCLYQLLLNE